MIQRVKHFAEAAERFCAWAEGGSSSPENEAVVALQHLSSLYQQALNLPTLSGDEDPGEVTHEEWTNVHRRLGSLPFSYYSQCSNPSDLSTDAPGVADLADDLADIWRDLKRGLSLFHAGHIEAAGQEWRQSFWQHWGHHAAGGLYALHSWFAERQQGAL